VSDLEDSITDAEAETGLPQEDDSESVSEPASEPEPDSGIEPDSEAAASELTRVSETAGDPNLEGDWWGDMPFTPIESLDDEDTQPIRTEPADDDLTRVSPVIASSDSDEDTQKVPAVPGSFYEENLDDIPTIPPSHVNSDWVPENPTLPKYVSEVDKQATRVTPAAYQPAQRKPDPVPFEQPPSARASGQQGQRPEGQSRSAKPARPVKPKDKKKKKKTLLKIAMAIFFLLILAALVLGSYVIYQYFRIASSLPDVGELREAAAKFETTRILDKNGNLLYEILDPNAGRRTYVSLEDISPYLIAATIATEDKDFYTNPGFDIFGMTRALWQNYTAGEIRSGASTITQQLRPGFADGSF